MAKPLGFSYGAMPPRRARQVEKTEEAGTRGYAQESGQPAFSKGPAKAKPTTTETTVIGRLRERQGIRKIVQKRLPRAAKGEVASIVSSVVGPRQRPSPRKPKTGK